MAIEEGRGEGRDKDPDEVTADSEHAAAQCRLRGVDLAWGLDLVRVVRVVTRWHYRHAARADRECWPAEPASKWQSRNPSRWPCGMPHGYVGASIWSLPLSLIHISEPTRQAEI